MSSSGVLDHDLQIILILIGNPPVHLKTAAQPARYCFLFWKIILKKSSRTENFSWFSLKGFSFWRITTGDSRSLLLHTNKFFEPSLNGSNKTTLPAISTAASPKSSLGSSNYPTTRTIR